MNDTDSMKQTVCDAIDAEADQIVGLGEAIMDEPELGFKETKTAGINRFAYMMMGVPTETRDEVKRTIDFASELQPEFLNYSICTPFPKTYLYENALKEGEFAHDYWQDFAERPNPDFKIKTLNRNMNQEELRRLQDNALRRFYFSASKIIRELKNTRDLRQLMTKARIGLRLILPRFSN
mgnify:CR=1 FL=1